MISEEFLPVARDFRISPEFWCTPAFWGTEGFKNVLNFLYTHKITHHYTTKIVEELMEFLVSCALKRVVLPYYNFGSRDSLSARDYHSSRIK